VIFLGNAASFHLQTWRRIYRLCDEPVHSLRSIHPLKGDFIDEGSVSLRPTWLAYAALGLRLRALPPGTFIHAHGASGYGLAALLSGRPYIVTIYGSEILRPHRTGYRVMVRAVLRRARAITVTSREARDRVVALAPATLTKTYMFHTGIDTDLAALIDSDEGSTKGSRLSIMLLRNTAPHYRTLEVLTAIADVIARRDDVEVVIPFGNGDAGYFAEVEARFTDPRFRFVHAPLSHAKYLQLIARSHVCVNFPVSDQVSATLVEALYFDRVVISNRLQAYEEIIARAQQTGNWIVVDGQVSLRTAIRQAIIHAERRMTDARPGREIVMEQFSIQNAARCFRPALKQLS
jgi:glycosyltransferase involved in cell wall biosynthesis